MATKKLPKSEESFDPSVKESPLPLKKGKSRDEKSHGSSLIYDDEQEAPEEFDFAKILRGISRHYILIILMALAGAVAGWAFYLSLAGTYTATSILIYQPVEQNKNLEQNFQMNHLTLASATEMVTLPIHLKAVISILSLPYGIEELEQKISVMPPGKNSNLIPIAVTDNHPEQAITIANTLASVVVKSSRDYLTKQWQAALTYFKTHLTDIQKQFAEESRKVAVFRQQHGFYGMDIGSSSLLQNLLGTRVKLQDANLNVATMQVEYDNMKKEFDKIPDTIPLAPMQDTTLQAQVYQIESALTDARTKYAPANPKIKALEIQLQDARNKLAAAKNETEEKSSTQPNPTKEKVNIDLATMLAKLKAAEKLRDELKVLLITLENQATTLTDNQLEFSNLVTDYNNLQNQILNTQQLINAIEITLNLGKSDVESYEAANKAFSHSSSAFSKLLPVIGLIFGSLLGLVTALFLEFFDPRFRTSKQVETALRVPCLASIPHFEILTRKNAEEKTLPYIRQIVDKLAVQGGYKSLAVTSAKHKEGRSLIAFYLAKYFHRVGKSTLFIEFDYSKNFWIAYDEETPVTLDKYLRGQAPINDIILHGNPDLMKTGYDPDLKELIKNSAMMHLWDTLKKNWEMIIVDLPSFQDEHYSSNIAAMCDATIQVVNASKTDRDSVFLSLKELEVFHAKLKGIVLNNIPRQYLPQSKSMRTKEQQQWNHRYKKNSKDTPS